MTSRLALFDQILSASLIQRVNSEPQDYKSYKARIKLKILEQRGDSGEKELKFEISRADDFEFLYSAVLNNDKYQELARNHDLTVDFDTFPKVIIQHLLCKNIVKNSDEEAQTAREKPGYHSIAESGRSLNTEINIRLEKDKGHADFEIFAKTPLSRGKIFAMQLQAVRGDQLIAHLLKICSAQNAQIATCQKDSHELAEMKEKWAELEKKTDGLQGDREKLEELEEKQAELLDELELVKEERENIRVLAEEKDDLVEDLQNDIHSLQSELDETREELDIVGKMLTEEQSKVDQIQKRNVALQKENGKLRTDFATLQKSNQKFEGLLKRNDLQQSQQSLDLRKLRELEADLKEKDSMIENLTGKIGMLKKELEDEKLKMQEFQTSFDSLKVDNESLKERLAMYRSQRFSPAVAATIGGGLQTTIPNSTGFKTVLGQNSPYANPITRTPFRDTSNSSSTGLTYQNSITPLPHQVSRFMMTNDETTGSSVTNTPPVMRNPL